ncbi:unnamed protein product [Citrullus colocynthis]|uniref:Uncharacterized protein n=1 Tax=Citrullus colocynthis TaxID=252529 RepID=A0ABP0XWW7_9ROSI
MVPIYFFFSGNFPSLSSEKRVVFLLTPNASHKLLDSVPIFIIFILFPVDPPQCLTSISINNRFLASDFPLGHEGPRNCLCGGYCPLALGLGSKALIV